MILGLDEPTSGSVTVNGRPPRAHAAPLHEVGGMLDPRAVHPSAAPTTTCSRSPRPPASAGPGWTRSSTRSGCARWRAARPASSPRHGAAARHRRRTARRPGHRGPGRAGQRPGRRGHPLDAGMLPIWPAQGKTVFVSSHLMSEIAQTATPDRDRQGAA
jgi:ABC-type uncharacterized transport system, ATPase component